MACDVNQLQRGACANGFSCLSNLRQYDVVMAELLCEIKEALVAGGGGGGGTQRVYAGNYGGVKPVFVPATTEAIATDTTTGTQWSYYSGDWH